MFIELGRRMLIDWLVLRMGCVYMLLASWAFDV